MRRLLALSLSLLVSAECYGAPASTGQVCQGTTGSAVATATCGSSLTVTTGNVIVCAGTGGASHTLSSITTSAGTASITWTAVANMHVYDATSDQSNFGGWGNITNGGTVTPQMNFNSATTGFNGIVCEEFSGVQGVSDGSNSISNAAAGTGTNAHKSGQITTTANGDLLVSGIADLSDNTATLNAGTVSLTYTKIATCASGLAGINVCLEWGVQPTAASLTEGDWTVNSAATRTSGNIIAIKATAAATGTICPSIGMLGVGCGL